MPGDVMPASVSGWRKLMPNLRTLRHKHNYARLSELMNVLTKCLGSWLKRLLAPPQVLKVNGQLLALRTTLQPSRLY